MYIMPQNFSFREWLQELNQTLEAVWEAARENGVDEALNRKEYYDKDTRVKSLNKGDLVEDFQYASQT